MNFWASLPDPEGNHYRPDGNKFTYTMYYVNDKGARIFVSGILADSKDKDKVGIYYIEHLEKDPDTGKYKTVEEFENGTDKIRKRGNVSFTDIIHNGHVSRRTKAWNGSKHYKKPSRIWKSIYSRRSTMKT